MTDQLLMPRKAKIADVVQETYDTFTYAFEVSDDDGFSFWPGQFNMLGLMGFSEAPISFSSLPQKNGFSHTIRSVGNVTNAVEKMTPGKELLFRGPFGQSWPLEETKGRHLLLIAGGIGMAPLRPAVLKALGSGDYRSVSLLYGARTPEDLLFVREFDGWTKKGLNILLTVDEVPGGTSWNGDIGVVTSLFDKLDIPFEEAVTFACGPEIMMRFVARSLMLRGHHESDVYVSMERRMRCGLAHCGHCQIGAMFVCKDGPVFAYNKIRQYADTLL